MKLLTISLAALSLAFFVRAEDDKKPEAKQDKSPVAELMKKHFKGKTSDIANASAGSLDKAAVEKLAEACKEMVKHDPPKGDKEAYKKVCDTLTASLYSLAKGEAGAAEKVKAAANCKACHDSHK
jgi:hypothetical protein